MGNNDLSTIKGINEDSFFVFVILVPMRILISLK